VDGLRLPATGWLTLPASGTYALEVSPQFSGELSYQLLLTTAPGGCAYTLAPSPQGFEASGGTGSVNVATGGNCTWRASATVDWVTFNTATGAGSGAAGFTIAPNTGLTRRAGQLFIGGQSVVVEQAGPGGNCLVAPIMPGQTAGVMSDSDCSSRVRANSIADRYSFTAPAGQQVLLSVTGESSFRADVLLLNANGTVVAQGLSGFSGSAQVTAGDGFVSLPGAGAYFVEVLPSASSSFTRGNYILSLTLAPAGCAFALSPTSRLFDAGAQTGSFNVTAGPGCTWMATSNAAWVTISSGASGAGNGMVAFGLDANTGAATRTGAITVGGQVFTITQAGAGGACLPAPITPGQNVNGNLSQADCLSLTRSSSRADRYIFTAEAGARLAITATTQLSSAALILYGPDGGIVAQVDATRLPRGGVIILPTSGQYTVEIASQSTGNYTLNVSLQATCAYVVTPMTVRVEAGAVTGMVTVMAAAGCDWNAAGVSDWISVPAGASFGSGNGALSFNVAANTQDTPRTGTLTVAGQTVTVVQVGRATLASAASFAAGELAPDSLAVAFARDIPTGATIKVRDSAGMTRDAQLFIVTPTQVNFHVPAETALGEATVIIIMNGNTLVASGATRAVAVAPGLFTANADGRGFATGVVLRVRNGVASYEPLVRLDPMTNRFVPVPIDLGPSGDEVHLVLFGTGLRARSALSAVTARVGGEAASVSYAGAQGSYVGVDQINMLLPRALAGRGEANIELSVDGKVANVVQVMIR
jgi:uncharacterized protein (TIGR03437 family)